MILVDLEYDGDVAGMFAVGWVDSCYAFILLCFGTIVACFHPVPSLGCSLFGS